MVLNEGYRWIPKLVYHHSSVEHKFEKSMYSVSMSSSSFEDEKHVHSNNDFFIFSNRTAYQVFKLFVRMGVLSEIN